MLWDTLERVNRLRQQALADPTFIESAKAHERALNSQQKISQQRKQDKSVTTENKSRASNTKPRKQNKPKTLADIYQQVEFTQMPEGRRH